MRNLTILDLTDDLLNVVANYLPPRARLSLACTSRRVFTAVWGQHGIPDIIRKYPLERRVEFSLMVDLDGNLKPVTNSSSLRTVPARARQQHLNVAVNPDGTLIAVLPYDNRLRLVCPRQNRVVAQHPMPVFANDVWDVSKGLRHPQQRPDAVVYADDAGLDVETTLNFSADGSLLVVASRYAVRFFRVCNGTNITLEPEAGIELRDALALIADNTIGTGGAADLSPDGKRLAWTVFVGKPAVVHITIWNRTATSTTATTTTHASTTTSFKSAVCNDPFKSPSSSSSSSVVSHVPASYSWVPDRVVKGDTVWTRRWAALAWARPLFTPNSRYLLVVINCAHKITRVVNVDGDFQRTKLCRFKLLRVDLQQTEASVSHYTEWLDLDSSIYPRLLAEAITRTLSPAIVHDAGMSFATVGKKKDPDTNSTNDANTIAKSHLLSFVSSSKVMRMPGLAFNSVHSCPAEATYKALSFGQARHPWFISKQPMFSFHFSPSGSRVILATSPHSNIVRTMCLEKQNDSYVLVDEHGPGRRRTVFKRMPWRAAFASVTAFSTSGQWLVGASLLDDDRCCVCIRNVTIREYFGDCDA